MFENNNSHNDLCYLTGALLGDGCLYKGKAAYQVSVTSEDQDFCEMCAAICNKLFDKQPRVKKIYKDEIYSYSQMIVCSKAIYNFFVDLTSNKTSIPWGDLKLNEVLDYRLSFIQGVMDADGWISRVNASDGYIRYRIGFKNTALWTDDIRIMVKDCEVKTGVLRQVKSFRKGRRSKDAYAFSINTKDYCQKVGFRISRKDKLVIRCLKEKYNGGKKNL